MLIVCEWDFSQPEKHLFSAYMGIEELKRAAGEKLLLGYIFIFTNSFYSRMMIIFMITIPTAFVDIFIYVLLLCCKAIIFHKNER